jgi:probable phosphoglycerate mutase
LEAVFGDQQQEALECLLKMAANGDMSNLLSKEKQQLAEMIMQCIASEKTQTRQSQALVLLEPPTLSEEEMDAHVDAKHTVSTVATKVTANKNNKLEIDLVTRFDGGSRGNPGIGGAGAVIHCAWFLKGNEEVHGQEVCLRKYLRQKVTCNQAEYQGVIRGLEEILNLVRGFQEQYDVNDREHCQVRLLIQGDSKLVINQLSGDWNCKSANMKPLLAKAQRLLSNLDEVSMTVITFAHIRRKYNAVADGMHLSILHCIDDFLLMPIGLIFIFLFLV